MTHHDNLAAVRAACAAANPAIETDSSVGLSTLSQTGPDGYVVEHPNEAVVKGREVQLADVLLALGSGYTYEVQGEEINLSGVAFNPAPWNLRLPLSGQTEETVAYLAALLKRDD